MKRLYAQGSGAKTTGKFAKEGFVRAKLPYQMLKKLAK